MANNNDELFVLIKGLNKNEKGYFRKFTGIYNDKGEGSYLKLFDCIARMKEYDETLIRKAFKGQKILNQLSVAKHYLKNMIIRALRNYHEDRMPIISQTMALADTHIMMSKGLYQSAEKKILKEKQAAIEREDFLQSLQWMKCYDNILTFSGKLTLLHETGAKIFMEKQKITEQYLNYNEYLALRTIVTPMVAKKAGKEDLKKLDYLLGHTLLSRDEKPLSNHARMIYTEILANIYVLKKDAKKGMAILKEQIAYFGGLEDNKCYGPFDLFVDVNLLLNFMGRHEAHEMAALINKCRKIISDSKGTLNAAYLHLIETAAYGHEIRMNLLLHKPEAALVTAHQLEQCYKKTPGWKDAELGFWMVTAIAYTALRQHDKALSYLNRIFTQKITEQNYILVDAHVLSMIVHVELGSFSIIKRQHTVAANFVKKSCPEAQDELWILGELLKFAGIIEAGNKKTIAAKAEGFLKAIKSKKIQHKEFLEDWLEGKM